MKVLLLWLAAVSLAAVVLTALDKSRARRGGRRVAERTLFTLALLGGAAAMLVTMRRIRHKTRHRRFMWGLPAIILLHIVILALFFVINYPISY